MTTSVEAERPTIPYGDSSTELKHMFGQRSRNMLIIALLSNLGYNIPYYRLSDNQRRSISTAFWGHLESACDRISRTDRYRKPLQSAFQARINSVNHQLRGDDSPDADIVRAIATLERVETIDRDRRIPGSSTRAGDAEIGDLLEVATHQALAGLPGLPAEINTHVSTA